MHLYNTVYKRRYIRSQFPYDARRHRFLVYMLLGLSLILLSYHVVVTRYRRQLQFYSIRRVYKDKELIFAATYSSNMTWVEEELPDWTANIYRADDGQAALTVPVNKGNEAMVYLTFVVPSMSLYVTRW